MNKQRVWVYWIGLLLAMGCYYLPWYTHDTAGFTTHAFDLAEWASLHPAVRSSSPAMLTSFLLRVPSLLLLAALALSANRLDDPRSRWVWRGVALLLALRFFPPSDFFTGAADDPNYRQMALLTGLGVGSVLAAIGLARLPVRWQTALLTGILVSGVIASWWGLSRAHTLLDNFEIAVATGPGIIGFSVISAALVVIVWWPSRTRFQAA